MTPATMFTIANAFAGIGWFTLLVLSPFWKGFDRFIVGIIVALLAVLYCYLNFSNFSLSIVKNFGSLDGVATIFQNKDLLLAGWAHFLVFDLFGAVWIKKNSVKYGISHLAIIPSIIFSCAFGPFGLLLYLLTRTIKTKQYLTDNF